MAALQTLGIRPLSSRCNQTPGEGPGFFGTNCHKDFIFNTSEHRGTFAEFRLPHRDTFQDCYEGCVAKFCNPATFNQVRRMPVIPREPDSWAAVDSTAPGRGRVKPRHPWPPMASWSPDRSSHSPLPRTSQGADARDCTQDRIGTGGGSNRGEAMRSRATRGVNWPLGARTVPAARLYIGPREERRPSLPQDLIGAGGGSNRGEAMWSRATRGLKRPLGARTVPAAGLVRGRPEEGEGMFTLRLKRESGGAKQRPALSVATLLPRKEDADATSFVVECSGRVAKSLNVPAKIEVILDGSMPTREVLGVVELLASFMPPELSLEGFAADEPVYVGGVDQGSTSVVLRNEGSHPLDIKLTAGPHFHVSPEKAMVEAGGRVQVLLHTARNSDGSQAQLSGLSVLEAILLPQGFRMTLAEVVAIPSQPVPILEEVAVLPRHRHAAAGGDGHFRALESTRRVLLWARTHGAPNPTKKFELRNPNPGSVIVELTLSGQGKAFFLVKMLGAGGRVSTLNGKTAGTRLAAGETMAVQVTHDPSGGPEGEGTDTPPRWACARLHIRSRCTSAVDTKSVGLYALGGCLRVDLHGVLPYRERCHLVDIGPPLPPGCTARQNITLFNSGDWNACICIEAGQDATGRGQLLVSPSCFVLCSQESKLVSLTYTFGDSGSEAKGGDPILPLQSIRVLYGYEVLRHRARRAFSRPDCKREPSELMLPFLACFQDENSADAQVAVSDHLAEEVFLRSVSQMTVSILSSDATASFLQTSDAASFAALEDTTFSARLSLPE